jgi:di/tricarboxylate transporter
MDKKKAKAVYRNIGLSLTALCVALNYVYRPYAYSHHLNDFHLADCYTSLFGVPIIVCLTQAFCRKESEKWSIPKNILYAVLFLLAWELVDGLLAKKTDWIDITASLISGCLTYALHRIFGFKNMKEYEEEKDERPHGQGRRRQPNDTEGGEAEGSLPNA